MIDLQEFCSDRKFIDRPWSRDGYTYATNGVIIVRVPFVKGVEDNPSAPSLKELSFDREVTEWLTPQIEKVEPIECSECDGKGYYTCQECGTEDIFCKNCGGKGALLPQVEVKVGRLTFSNHILQLIADLPDIKIENRDPEPYIPVKFVFEGGDGMIMPLRII